MHIKGSPENNFFDDNPQVRYITPFKELAEEDEDKASTILWGIYMLDDIKSEFADMPKEEREQQVKENYLGDSFFNLDDWGDLRQAYKIECMTIKEKLLRGWKDKLEERDHYLLNTPYETDPNGQDTLLKNSKAIWDQYIQVEKEVLKERFDVENRAGYQESMVERSKF